jgi:PHD/YefM family antitoxin component YafN of YafNO toxin-antitoxin module
MKQETVTISRQEYEELKKKAGVDEGLLQELVRGLEDIKAGRVKPWKRTTAR